MRRTYYNSAEQHIKSVVPSRRKANWKIGPISDENKLKFKLAGCGLAAGCWLAGWLAGCWLAGWLLDGWLAGLLLAGWVAGCWLAGWLAGCWLAAGWLLAASQT